MTRRMSRRRFVRSVAATSLWLASGPTRAASAASAVVIRKEITTLTADELARLREAFRQLQANGGPSGYQDLAGIHGLPQRKCQHHNPTWLPWHRIYILNMERALRQIDASVSLPFWDWMSAVSIQSGIPDAYSAPHYTPPGGGQMPNPLYSALLGPLNRLTRRLPLPPSNLARYANKVQAAFTTRDFDTFSEALAMPHDDLHGWVGGDMGIVDNSAYDPLFWAHHANVDRLWAQWQLGPNNDNPPDPVLQTVLDPFGTMVAQTIDYVHNLNYDYDVISPMPPIQIIQSTARGKDEFRVKRPEAAAPPKPKVILHVYGLAKIAGSYRFHVFVNQPDATAETHLANNAHYAGTFSLFGTVDTKEAERHHGHQGRRVNQRTLDITQAVEKHSKPGEDLNIKLVVTDMMNHPVNVAQLPITGISIEQSCSVK